MSNSHPRKHYLLAACFFSLLLIFFWCGWFLYQFQDPPARQVFIHDLTSLRIGMSVDEVEHVMGRYIKGAGPKWGMVTEATYPHGKERMRANGTMTYRWNASDGRYDSDWGQVTFENGRVVKTEFLPD